VPTTDDADLYLDLIANCYHVLAAGRDQPVSVDEVMMRFWGWCQRWAPHTTSDQALAIVRQELAGPPELIGDDVAGRAIRLAYADRMRLKITTIGSYDVDRAGRTRSGRTTGSAKRIRPARLRSGGPTAPLRAPTAFLRHGLRSGRTIEEHMGAAPKKNGGGLCRTG
jgi:hypothetical protein